MLDSEAKIIVSESYQCSTGGGHSWGEAYEAKVATRQQNIFKRVQKCAHCGLERVIDPSA